MWNRNIPKYTTISLSEDRHLIAKAQGGSAQSKDELILRHINFLASRIRGIVFPNCLKRFGEDLLSEGILIIHAKINDYDLDYCNIKESYHREISGTCT